MKQLTLFETESSKTSKKSESVWHLYVDGAARNNPGPAGAGFCLLKDGKAVLKKGFYLGKKTNNQAEYFALLVGLFYAQQYVKDDEPLVVIGDSQLLVRQMRGDYKVKNVELKQLQKLAYHLLMPFNYSLEHVLRAENEQADEMANEGIDKKVKLPSDFIQLLDKYEISY